MQKWLEIFFRGRKVARVVCELDEPEVRVGQVRIIGGLSRCGRLKKRGRKEKHPEAENAERSGRERLSCSSGLKAAPGNPTSSARAEGNRIDVPLAFHGAVGNASKKMIAA
jgi:hypothetical protein